MSYRSSGWWGRWFVIGGMSGKKSDVPIFTVLDCRFAL
jgi:hypothetical protein